jgi:hypothetical protein
MAPPSARTLLRPLVATIAVALALAGCGGGPSGSAASQRTAVRRTIVTFMRELAAGNGMVACEGLTVGGASSLSATLGPELGNFGIDGCVAVVGVIGSGLSATLRNQLANVTVGAVTLDGSKATVSWSALPSAVAAFFGSSKPITLIWEKNFWYVDGF